jgi:hypothetical protein
MNYVLNWLHRKQIHRRAVQAAKQAFQQDNPNKPIVWAQFQVDEGADFIVRIGSEYTRPPNLTFYAVNKTTGVASRVINDAAYRPRVWR